MERFGKAYFDILCESSMEENLGQFVQQLAIPKFTSANGVQFVPGKTYIKGMDCPAFGECFQMEGGQAYVCLYVSLDASCFKQQFMPVLKPVDGESRVERFNELRRIMMPGLQERQGKALKDGVFPVFHGVQYYCNRFMELEDRHQMTLPKFFPYSRHDIDITVGRVDGKLLYVSVYVNYRVMGELCGKGQEQDFMRIIRRAGINGIASECSNCRGTVKTLVGNGMLFLF